MLEDMQMQKVWASMSKVINNICKSNLYNKAKIARNNIINNSICGRWSIYILDYHKWNDEMRGFIYSVLFLKQRG